MIKYTIGTPTTQPNTHQYTTSTSESKYEKDMFSVPYEWLENAFVNDVIYHINTPYDPVHTHQNLKHIDVMEYIIRNNWDISLGYADASIPNSYDSTDYVCTSSNGTSPRRRRC